MKPIIPLLLLSMLTACSTATLKDPVANPQGLTNPDLIKVQIEHIAKLEREMEKREQELKYQHLKELTQDRKSTRLNSSHIPLSRMPSSA